MKFGPGLTPEFLPNTETCFMSLNNTLPNISQYKGQKSSDRRILCWSELAIGALWRAEMTNCLVGFRRLDFDFILILVLPGPLPKLRARHPHLRRADGDVRQRGTAKVRQRRLLGPARKQLPLLPLRIGSGRIPRLNRKQITNRIQQPPAQSRCSRCYLVAVRTAALDSGESDLPFRLPPPWGSFKLSDCWKLLRKGKSLLQILLISSIRGGGHKMIQGLLGKFWTSWKNFICENLKKKVMKVMKREKL